MDVFDLDATGRRPVALLDLRDEEPRLVLSSVLLSESGMTPEQYHRHELIFALPALADVEQLDALIAAGQFEDLVRQIEGGYESSWDGSNSVATYTGGAEEAIGALGDALRDIPALDVVANPPPGFTASILLVVAENALESYANGLCSEDEYEVLVDAYGAELARRIQDVYPGYSVEYTLRPLRGEEPYRVSVAVSHGGAEAETRWQQAVEQILEELDHGTIADGASATTFSASRRL